MELDISKISNGVGYGDNKMLINRHSTSHSLRTIINYCDILTLLKWWEKQKSSGVQIRKGLHS